MAGAATAAAALRVWGANDRIRLGIIGSGMRGQYLMGKANGAGRHRMGGDLRYLRRTA